MWFSRDAVFSPDRKYRYKLVRTWDESARVVLFVGLNPSTADENKDDPTIRRCMGFARLWGYGGLFMGNLFALVSTDPKKLTEPGLNVVGEYNNDFLLAMNSKAAITVAAWGSFGNVLGGRPSWVWSNLKNLYCLGINHDGAPKHPLYLSAKTPLKALEVMEVINNRSANEPLTDMANNHAEKTQS